MDQTVNDYYTKEDENQFLSFVALIVPILGNADTTGNDRNYYSATELVEDTMVSQKREQDRLYCLALLSGIYFLAQYEGFHGAEIENHSLAVSENCDLMIERSTGPIGETLKEIDLPSSAGLKYVKGKTLGMIFAAIALTAIAFFIFRELPFSTAILGAIEGFFSNFLENRVVIYTGAILIIIGFFTIGLVATLVILFLIGLLFGLIATYVPMTIAISAFRMILYRGIPLLCLIFALGSLKAAIANNIAFFTDKKRRESYREKQQIARDKLADIEPVYNAIKDVIEELKNKYISNESHLYQSVVEEYTKAKLDLANVKDKSEDEMERFFEINKSLVGQVTDLYLNAYKNRIEELKKRVKIKV